MAKWASSYMYRGNLAGYGGMSALSIGSLCLYCSGAVSTYASAVNSAGAMLCSAVISGGACTVSDLAASTWTASWVQCGSGTVSFAGNIDHIAHADGSAGVLLLVTTATSRAVIVGDTVYTQAHTYTRNQPT